jgi:phage terminase small subunit
MEPTGALTAKQEKFCCDYLRTGNATEAYRLNYKYVNDAHASVKSYQLLKNPKIKKRIAELNQPLVDAAIITREGNLCDLRDIIKDKDQPGAVRVRAIGEANKMLGFYATEKKEVMLTRPVVVVETEEEKEEIEKLLEE